ncbi:MAG: SCO family protein [Sulfobacillus sp.]
MRSAVRLLQALLVVAIAALGAHLYLASKAPPYRPLPPLAGGAGPGTNAVLPVTELSGHLAPGFTLTDQFGRPVTLSQLRGKTVVLAFIDSQCVTICPLTSAAMVAALHLLGPAASQVALVAIDANPSATSVADVRAYSVAHGLLYGWQFLTGSLTELKAVWRHYGVYVAAVSGNIDHTPALYVIGPNGHERALLVTAMDEATAGAQAQILAQQVADTLPGRPQLTQVAPGRPITAAMSATLPLAAGGRVAIGPGANHLFVFFGTWLSEFGNLGQTMASQDPYVQAASQHGWPSLVAVDEAVTEPTASALGQFLAQMRPPLAYPVAVDTNGRLAGGLGLVSTPEYMLVVGGRLVWKHLGWLSAAALETAVAAHVGAG